MTVLLTPTARATGQKLGGRTYRKQILKRGQLDYRAGGQTRRLVFDDQLFSDLSQAFHDKAYDSAKVFAADGENRHTVDPDRLRGTVVDLVPSEDGSGLDAVVTLSEDGARLVDEHPDLGVSARIKHNLTRGDGKSWRHALHHVLLTTDPKVTGLSPWESVDLSAELGDGGDVIDLSTHVLTEGGATMADLSDSDIERIVGELSARMSPTGPDPDPGPGPIDWGDFFDDDVDEADIAAFFDSMDDDEGGGWESGEPEPVGAGADLSTSHHDGGEYWDLAAQNAALSDQVTRMHDEMAATRWQNERAQLLSQGVPPAMLDLAEPVLSASAAGETFDLSNSAGDVVDVAGVVRGLLRQHIGYVDLSEEVGHSHGAPADHSDTAALHAAWESERNMTRKDV